MAGDCLIDSNIVTAYYSAETGVVDHILGADSVAVSTVVLGELYYGAMHSRQVAHNLSNIDRLLSWAALAVCDHRTAAVYGSLKQGLRAKGRLIPDNDIWIAASAKQQGVTLVSRDQHFALIEGLDWVQW